MFVQITDLCVDHQKINCLFSHHYGPQTSNVSSPNVKRVQPENNPLVQNNSNDGKNLLWYTTEFIKLEPKVQNLGDLKCKTFDVGDFKPKPFLVEL